MSKVFFCECGNERDPDERGCEECKVIFKNRDKRKKIGFVPKREKFIDLTMGNGVCEKCGKECSPRSSFCNKCYKLKMNDYEIKYGKQG